MSDNRGYAMLKNSENIVFDTIVADSSFKLDGYYFIEIKEGVMCQPGMFYNKKDGLFYDDEEFTTILGAPVEP